MSWMHSEPDGLKPQFTPAAAIPEAPAPKEAKEKDKAPLEASSPAMAVRAPSMGMETVLMAGVVLQAPAAVKGRARATAPAPVRDPILELGPAQPERVLSLASRYPKMASLASLSSDPLWTNSSPKQRKSGKV